MKNNNKQENNKTPLLKMLAIIIRNLIIGLPKIIIVVVSIFIIFFICAYLTPYKTKNVLKSLQAEYNGEKFIIVENYGKKNNESGLYVISPKDNKDIKFDFFNTMDYKSSMDDYEEFRLKYYYNKIGDENLKSEFQVCEKENSYTELGQSFTLLNYYLEKNINDYYEIENAINTSMKLLKEFNDLDKNINKGIYIQNPVINLSYEVNYQKENMYQIEELKNDYIQKLKENNQISELDRIGNEEINKVWKPSRLSIVLNGRNITNENKDIYVIYEYENKYYTISNADSLLKYIPNVKIIGESSDGITKIKYNSKEYKIEHSTGKNKSNKIYLYNSVNDLFKTMEYNNILYDYDNMKLIINK